MKRKKIVIAPSILTADFSHLADQIRIVQEAGADWLHLDVMDGHFVPNLTFGPPIIENIRKVTPLPLDAHLMIEQPERYLKDFQQAGVDSLTIHVETGYHLHRTVEQIQNLGMKAGIALNPATPVVTIEPLLPYVDLVLVMSVNPGFGGQTFIAETSGKISTIAGMIDQAPRAIWLQVDGGLDENTVPSVLQAGATALVIGSAIYDQPDAAKAVKKFQNLINHFMAQ